MVSGLKIYFPVLVLVLAIISLVMPPSICGGLEDRLVLSLDGWEDIPLDTLIQPENVILVETVTGHMVFKTLEQGISQAITP